MATGNTLGRYFAQDGDPPVTGYAQKDSRNSIPVLNFDASANEYMIFSDVLPSNYAGGGLTFDLYWMALVATSGDVRWGVSIERNNEGNRDLDADGFATEQLATGTANAASGKLTKTTITVSSGANMDSAVAGNPVRIKVRRLATDGADTMTGDAQLRAVHMKET
jgi:hypothetical protein